jgi:adenine C2-methylase RlmN of 23S rRNA A2503 and tRNA A37
MKATNNLTLNGIPDTILVSTHKQEMVMTKQFVQVSARKDSNNFAHCSNLSMMANEGLTATQAIRKLQVMADEYEAKGYTIEWIREDFDAAYEEMYGDLFA